MASAKPNTVQVSAAISEKLTQESHRRLKELLVLEKSDRWEKTGGSDGVAIFNMRPPGSSLDYIKGVGEVECTVEEFMNALDLGVELIAKVDKMYAYGTNIAQITPTLSVHHSCFYAPGRPLISDRDVTYIGYVNKEDHCAVCYDTMYQADVLAEAKITIPAPKSGVVRAELLGSGYIFRPIPGTNKLEVIYIVQLDPKGMIPTWVVNRTASQQAMNVLAMRQYFDKLHSAR